jgi:hypothetical protein
VISRAHVVAFALVTCGIGVLVACSDKETACTVDTDCGQGSFCRDGVCASVGVVDAGNPDSQPPIACSAPGASCTVDDECCTRPCTAFRCSGTGTSSSGASSGGAGSSGSSGTSGTSGTTSSGGTCVDLYGLCSSDFECCPALSCTTGTCR